MLLFGLDEEVGGGKGMEQFVKTEEFRSLNVGVDIDEGFPQPEGSENILHITYAEKVAWREYSILAESKV